MKDPNVLEAIDLCVNGNKVDNPDDIWIYEITCMIQNCLRSLRKPWPAFEKGTHVSRPIGEGPEPIIMPNGKNLNFGGLSLKEFHNAARILANAGPNPFKD